MNDELIVFIITLIFYYIVRYFIDSSLPLIPGINGYRNIDDVISGIIQLLILVIGSFIGFIILYIMR
ncbi:hypothetical protein [Inediibacterium massiliense]|uniref:hypothetical protein n=1 Tax=Inediibacterium massiliense TaxID=1658111 RepID=UPI0006B626BF|nr:hypothetical protein [Inediibacterium massiliense]